MAQVDFSAMNPGTSSAPFIQDGLSCWSYISNALQPTYMIEDDSSTRGYRCPDLTIVLLPETVDTVTLALLAPDRVRIQGLDINMDDNGDPKLVTASQNVQLVPLHLQGLRAIRIECNSEALLQGIEWG